MSGAGTILRVWWGGCKLSMRGAVGGGGMGATRTSGGARGGLGGMGGVIGIEWGIREFHARHRREAQLMHCKQFK